MSTLHQALLDEFTRAWRRQASALDTAAFDFGEAQAAGQANVDTIDALIVSARLFDDFLADWHTLAPEARDLSAAWVGECGKVTVDLYNAALAFAQASGDAARPALDTLLVAAIGWHGRLNDIEVAFLRHLPAGMR